MSSMNNKLKNQSSKILNLDAFDSLNAFDLKEEIDLNDHLAKKVDQVRLLITIFF